MSPIRLLRPSVKRNISLYRRRFLQAKPFKHVVIKNAFNPALVRRLKDHLERESLKRIRNRFHQAHEIVFTQAKSLFVKKWLLAFFQEMIPWVESVTKIKVTRLWAGLRLFSFEGSDYADTHNDYSWMRAVRVVLFLSDFKPHEGGRLLLLNSRKGEVIKWIPHRFNTLILFEVHSRSWHQVEAIQTNKKRLTASGILFKQGCERWFINRLKHLNSRTDKDAKQMKKYFRFPQ